MNNRSKLLSWVNGLVRKAQPTQYCALSDQSSDEDLYEEIENYSKEYGIHREPGTIEYNQYIQEYFFALRDLHINRKRLNKNNRTASVIDGPSGIVHADYEEQNGQYQFLESELKKRLRGNVCLPDRPRICVCSCEPAYQRPRISPRNRSVLWDAGWVFYADNRDMRRLARRSSERLNEALFASGNDD